MLPFEGVGGGAEIEAILGDIKSTSASLAREYQARARHRTQPSAPADGCTTTKPTPAAQTVGQESAEERRMLAWFDRHFSIALPPGRFLRNTVLLSLAALAPVLGLYIARTPGFAGHLAGTEGALRPFLRQILTNGLPVVLAVNWVALILFARARAGTIRTGAALALDFAARIGLFAALNGAVFVVSALVFGSFGGDPAQALAALGPTLARAAAFDNLAGVYLYATLVGALPLHMTLVAIMVAQRGHRGARLTWLALPAVGIVAVQLMVLTGLGWVLSWLV